MIKQIARRFEWISWVIVVYVVLQILPVSALSIWPQQALVEGYEVTMHRVFPGDFLGLPRPRLSYVEVVKPLTPTHNDGHPCSHKDGPFRYSRGENVATWGIPWATDCLNDPVGFVWTADWTWHIGSFTVGSVSHKETILRARP